MKFTRRVALTGCLWTLMHGASLSAQTSSSDQNSSPAVLKSKSEQLKNSRARTMKLLESELRPSKCGHRIHNHPFPAEVVQIFAFVDSAVFAYPEKFECDSVFSGKLACVVNRDSLYFIRMGDRGATIHLEGIEPLIVLFGGPKTAECFSIGKWPESAGP